MASEHTFNHDLCRRLRDAGLYVWKINDNYEGGVPDIFIAGTEGRTMFVECKYIHELPKRDSTPVIPALSDQQWYWLTSRSLQGVRVSVIMGIGKQAAIFDDSSEWKTGVPSGVLKDRLLSKAAIVDWIIQTTAPKQECPHDHHTNPAHA